MQLILLNCTYVIVSLHFSVHRLSLFSDNYSLIVSRSFLSFHFYIARVLLQVQFYYGFSPFLIHVQFMILKILDFKLFWHSPWEAAAPSYAGFTRLRALVSSRM